VRLGFRRSLPMLQGILRRMRLRAEILSWRILKRLGIQSAQPAPESPIDAKFAMVVATRSYSLTAAACCSSRASKSILRPFSASRRATSYASTPSALYPAMQSARQPAHSESIGHGRRQVARCYRGVEILDCRGTRRPILADRCPYAAPVGEKH
jgi:hypothetical protein